MQIQKTNKKVISVNKVMINYSQEILIIRKLLIDKQLSAIGNLIELYFSLGKCEFVVDKITQTNKALKYPINTSHTMLSISSITMKTYLI